MAPFCVLLFPGAIELYLEEQVKDVMRIACSSSLWQQSKIVCLRCFFLVSHNYFIIP